MATQNPTTRSETGFINGITLGDIILFAEAKARVRQILELIDEYRQITSTIADLGYVEACCHYPPGRQRQQCEQDTHRHGPAGLELLAGGMNLGDADFLDDLLELGPRKKELPLTIRTPLLAERDRLGAETGWKCFYCGEVGQERFGPDGRVWHVDHAYPIFHGGDDQPDNHVLACATCNLEKKSRTAKDYFLWLASNAETPLPLVDSVSGKLNLSSGDCEADSSTYVLNEVSAD